LADLAADVQRAAAKVSPAPPVQMPAALTNANIAPKSAAAAAAAGIPLAYLGAQSQRDRDRASAHTTIDPKRDYYAPCALLLTGSLLYISYYILRYNLGPAGILATSIGLTVMGAFECILLVGFALVMAGPLNVSFGGIGTAILKLAAIAIFCDGVNTWVDGALLKYAAGFGRGIFGFGVIGIPVAAGVYWTALIYLFDMDPGDSWMVVVILVVYYEIVRTILVVLLLKWVLTMGGVPASSIILPSIAGAPPPNPMVEQVNELKEKKLLVEARQYATDNSRGAEIGLINAWYAAACPNVWYEMSRDINGHGLPYGFVVELPKDKDSRAKCYDALKHYWDTNKIYYDATSLQDNGEPYLMPGGG